MATAEASAMRDNDDIYTRIRSVFGRYKAEWLREDLFPLFRRPEYFPEFEEPRPTVLVGGRGTGKTTVLKCLSYEGLYHLQGRSAAAAIEAQYVGLYWCVDANRVTALEGPELANRLWQRIFAHYVNLEIVDQLSRYASWFEAVSGRQLKVEARLLKKVAVSLHVPPPDSIVEFTEAIEGATVKLEAMINTIVDEPPGDLSIPGAPIEYMTEALASDPSLRGKAFYILVDEFENLSFSQQMVLNTLIKHGRDRHTFKIGVKEGGWRTRATLAQNEPLSHPADYDLIDLGERLSDGSYASFATEVCDTRLARAMGPESREAGRVRIRNAFESLSAEEEAQLLGVKNRVRDTRKELVTDGEAGDVVELLSDLELFYIARRAATRSVPVSEELAQYQGSRERYMRNFRDNYRQALLFTVSEHTGRGIQKYYAGWDVLVKVSGGNIRYMVELVERAFAKHGLSGRPITEPVSARHQTEACIEVGKKYAQEVQSLDPEGARLTYLLLGLGRFFNLLARHSAGKQPDTTSFVVSASRDSAVNLAVETLLKLAVMHQVLRRSPATKATADVDAKEWEYSLHPIFAAFFVVPYQKKRRVRLRADHLDILSKDVRQGLSVLLKGRRRLNEVYDAMPEQLSLFEAAYV